ncbi:MAG: glycerophosphodiester phosphodiesterase [Proteobacteria bacterium]|nr:glycerophosphodiester phosphodiesterase [Pseudomonadota bacterium]
MAPVIIAHRGASAYLPEHTLPAKALAYAMGADFLEQDVVATRDDELVVLHDIYLDRVTDVATRYPDRRRPDRRYYVRDFDLEEVKALNVWERVKADGNAVFPGRFPVRSGHFRIHTLDEELTLIRSLNETTGGTTGIYPEIKRPAWHREEGVDIAPLFLSVLDKFDYRNRDDNVYVQCFDAGELERLRHDLGCKMKLIQLIGENTWGEAQTDYEALRTDAGLRQLAQTVDGIGPWTRQLYELGHGAGAPVSTGMVMAAQKLGLAVHPYTFRADDLPPGFATFEELVSFFVGDLAVDGLFTDFPDRARKILTDLRAHG